MIYRLDTEEHVSAAMVGGKGFSLIQAQRAGMRVPEGCVLGAFFFRPWLDALHNDESWKGLSSSSKEEIAKSCRILKTKALGLMLDAEHTRLILRTLAGIFGSPLPLMAVRSSSPEEDTQGSSFAGAYESILGVSESALADSIREVFSSCLDERIVVYKRERGYDPTDVKIAVIIQRLVRAERSGVAFSVNPLNNDHDEVLINASFGLGESIVSGTVTPDTYMYGRITNRITEKRIGRKETGVFVKAGGGTEQRNIGNPRMETLGEGEASEIARLCVRAEEFLGKPADIEWAYEGGVAYLLQARPITTLFTLPPVMLTGPDEPRRLYLDFTLVAQGIHKPLSVLGMEFFTMIQNGFMKSLLGLDAQGLEEGFFDNVESRSYMNVTNILKMPGGNAYAKKLGREDPIVVSILDGLPKDAYKTPGRPKKSRFFIFKVMKNALRFLRLARKAYRDPRAYKAYFSRECEKRLKGLERIEQGASGLKDFARALEEWYSDFISSVSLAMTTASHSFALQSIKKTFGKHGEKHREAVLKLERGLPDNITVAMGLDLEELVSFDSFREYGSYDEWSDACRAEKVPQECRKAFEGYLSVYGFRCPMEMDVRTIRPADDPASFYRTVRERAIHERGRLEGKAMYEKARREREEAYDFLKNTLPEGRKRKRFEKDYEVWVNLGGYREIHKYYVVYVIHRLRQKAVHTGGKLADEGRLRDPQDVFDLTFDQIADAMRNPLAVLEGQRDANTAWRRTHWSNVRDFPIMFDSRGRILRPARTDTAEGEYRGQGISPGTVEGRIKVLHSPEEKPLYPGEILVARATDPGWTPLFVPAAAVILEIGGAMQHGAVVAREYGKPCITGIEGATELFTDGDLVSVDGACGIVRVLEKSGAS